MCHLLIACFLVAGAHGFNPAPIRWGGSLTKKFFLAPQTFLNAAVVPQNLVILDLPGPSPDVIPYFTANIDNTITWDARGWCLDASGDKLGSVIRVNHCTGGSSQMWNWVPNGHGQNMVQLRGTNKCLDIGAKGGSLNGALVQLWECDDTATDSWEFETIPLPEQGEATLHSVRHVALSLISLAAFAVLSLGTWLVRSRAKARMSATRHNGEQRCVSMTTPLSGQDVALAVMAGSSIPNETIHDVAQQVQKTLESGREAITLKVNTERAERELECATRRATIDSKIEEATGPPSPMNSTSISLVSQKEVTKPAAAPAAGVKIGAAKKWYAEKGFGFILPDTGGVAQLQLTQAVKKRRRVPNTESIGLSQTFGFLLVLRTEACIEVYRRVMDPPSITQSLWGARCDLLCFLYQQVAASLRIQRSAVGDVSWAFDKLGNGIRWPWALTKHMPDSSLFQDLSAPGLVCGSAMVASLRHGVAAASLRRKAAIASSCVQTRRRAPQPAMITPSDVIDLGVKADTFLPQFLWLLIIAFPRARFTERVMGPIGPFIGLSLIHLTIVLLAATKPGGTEPILIFADVFNPAQSQLDGMVRLFEVRDFVAEEWPHVLIWDLFVGRAIWLDALERDTPFAWSSLLLTNGIGPPGLLLYIVLCLGSGRGLPSLGYKAADAELQQGEK